MITDWIFCGSDEMHVVVLHIHVGPSFCMCLRHVWGCAWSVSEAQMGTGPKLDIPVPLQQCSDVQNGQRLDSHFVY